MDRKCMDCGRPRGEDFENPVKGHCYAAWFTDWQSTDCWRIASEAYAKRPLREPSDG